MNAQVETLRPLFDPKSIAIIGASSDLTKIGGRPIKGLIDYGYKGKVYPINPKYESIAGFTCFSDIKAVPEEVDLAIIVLPSSMVVNAAKACGEQGVRSIVVFSSGFAEVNEEGERAQEELLQICKKHNMRMLGPNCVGFFNLSSGIMANFGVGKHLGSVSKGKIGMVSHSGAFSSQLYIDAAKNDIGLNYFIGIGNQADVDIADCISYMSVDPHTEVILCYMEGVDDLEKLSTSLQLAKRNNKIVIILKSGQSETGKKAALFHTATEVGTDSEYEEMFRQAGVIRVESVQELFDVFKAVAYKIPEGGNVAIFTISGGAGILLADELAKYGINYPEPMKEVQTELKRLIPYASVMNPIDMTAQLINDPDLMGEFMNKVLSTQKYDLAITYLASSGCNKPVYEKFLKVLEQVQEKNPNVVHLLSTVCTRETMDLAKELNIAYYDDPSRAAKVTRALCQISGNFHQVKQI